MNEQRPEDWQPRSRPSPVPNEPEARVVRLTCGHCHGDNPRDLPYDASHQDVCIHCGRILKPIPMILTCPSCNERHYDEGEFAHKPHHTHACQGCGLVWRPSKEFTVGVRFLPGYKNPQD